MSLLLSASSSPSPTPLSFPPSRLPPNLVQLSLLQKHLLVLLLVLWILQEPTDSQSSMLQPIDGLPPLSLPPGPCRTSSSTYLFLKLNGYSNGSANATALPLACPQSNVDPSTFSEDCLSMILYVPTTLTSTSSASTLVWFFSIPTVMFSIF